MKKNIIIKAFFEIFLVISLIFIFSFFNAGKVYAEEERVCCEKANIGAGTSYCQYTNRDNCDPSYGIFEGTCDEITACKPVCCDVNSLGYYGSGGRGCFKSVSLNTCVNTLGGQPISDPQCNVQQCSRGCCIVGNQATLSTEFGCVNLTGAFPDLEMDFRPEITTEIECLNVPRSEVKGCCVTSQESGYGPKNCGIDTFEKCNSVNGEFYEGVSCASLPSGNRDCDQCKYNEATAKKACAPEVDGGEDVYYFDNCGNPDKKAEDCDYGLGTLCREKNGETKCRSLNCNAEELWDNPAVDEDNDGVFDNDNSSTTKFNGRNYRLNGESWCEYDADAGPTRDLPGTRHFVHSCYEGEEKVIECKDYRKEYCVQFDGLEIDSARCQENKASENLCSECDDDKDCCQNPVLRSCVWISAEKKQAVDDLKRIEEDACANLRQRMGDPNYPCPESRANEIVGNSEKGKCIPLVPPGITNNENTCSAADTSIKSYWSKGALGDDWDCDAGCKIYTNEFAYQQNNYCRSLGDCGADYNLAGEWSGNSFFRTCSVAWSNLEDVDEGGVKDFGKDYTHADDGAKKLIRDCLDTLIDPGIYNPKAESFASFIKYNNNLMVNLPPEVSEQYSLTSYYVAASIGGATLLAFALAAWVTGTELATLLLSSAGLLSLFGPIGAVVSVLLIVISLVVILGGDNKKQEVDIGCKPWQPPLGAKNCNLCNEPGERTYFSNGEEKKEYVDLTAGGKHQCTKYLCGSLGQGCQYIESEQGPRCINACEDPLDTSSPVRKPLSNLAEKNKDLCSAGIDPRSPDAECNPSNVVDDIGQGGYDIKFIKANTDFVVGLETNELSVCRWDWERKSKYEELGKSFDQVQASKVHTYLLKSDIDILPGDSKTMHVICKDVCDNPQLEHPSYSIDIQAANTLDIGAPAFTSILPPDGFAVKADANFTIANLRLNEKANCRWSKTNVPYDLMNAATQVDCNLVSRGCDLVFSGLTSGENTYYIRCRDYDNNTNADAIPSNAGYRIIRSDPLVIDNFKCKNSLGDNCDVIYDRNFTLEIKTSGGGYNGRAVCFARSSNDLEYEFFNTNSSTHSQTIGPRNTGDYTENVKCRDDAGNQAEVNVSFSMISDDNAPKILKINVEGSSLNILTDEAAVCKYSESKDLLFDDMPEFETTGSLTHSTSFGVNNYLHVKCKDRFDHIISADVYKIQKN